MERDYGQELDQLKEQMEALRQEMASQVERLREEAQAALPNQPTMERLGRVEVPRGMHPDSRLSQQMEELCRRTEAQGASGYVTYRGVYNAGGRQSNWIRNAVSTDGLLAQIEAAWRKKVLACIGNANRLALLLEILRGAQDGSPAGGYVRVWLYRSGVPPHERPAGRRPDSRGGPRGVRVLPPQGPGHHHAAGGHQRHGGRNLYPGRLG